MILYMYYPEHQIRSVKFTSIDITCIISSPNSMFNHLLESSHGDDSNKWSNIGFDEETGIIEIKIRTLSGALYYLRYLYVISIKVIHLCDNVDVQRLL